MDWSASAQDGFALAAAAHGDRGAACAVAGLASDAVEPATATARRIAELDAGARRLWVRKLLEPRPLPRAPGPMPERALALLAAFADRELGRRWLLAAPPPRPGYAPDPGLLALLRALAVHDADGG